MARKMKSPPVQHVSSQYRPAQGKTVPKKVRRLEAQGLENVLIHGSNLEIRSIVRKGIKTTHYKRIADELQLSPTELGKIVHISPQLASARSRSAKASFEPDESERLLRIERLRLRARDVLQGDEKARVWLKTRLPALDGATPLEVADTEPGAREVEDILTRIQHSVF